MAFVWVFLELFGAVIASIILVALVRVTAYWISRHDSTEEELLKVSLFSWGMFAILIFVIIRLWVELGSERIWELLWPF